MIPLLIVVGLVIVAAAAAYGLRAWRASRDPLDRRASRSAAGAVLRQAIASVPANAFDARLRIVRHQT